MKNNSLLTVATALGTFFAILLALGLAVLTFVFVHWHITPEVYKKVKVDMQTQELVFINSKGETVKIRQGGEEEVVASTESAGAGEAGQKQRYIPLPQVDRSTLYSLYLHTAGILLLLFFITKEVLKVIKSVQELTTFRRNNVQSFRKIGFMCLGISLLQWVTSFFMEGYSRDRMTPMLCMLAAFILAEVFKEGNRLLEQDQLTI
ncbi:DUF2975 domain-containing protein [Rufibacter glacialis]|uniref:DUF2975 domain-containing protein n=1 Tax=Rufibacter glacialis TaxID=1259555 RepID=A0A5M8QDX2_9BACT|nr:DUF2975 domain-containing protein [Rufibacter glacialis]KAA6433378.1 DUF2975 domain-containing protein [Rufibacter glacialis]GGK74725.1 hypothetical protein GCM10011405_23490 [Rufibacter glacialis]